MGSAAQLERYRPLQLLSLSFEGRLNTRASRRLWLLRRSEKVMLALRIFLMSVYFWAAEKLFFLQPFGTCSKTSWKEHTCKHGGVSVQIAISNNYDDMFLVIERLGLTMTREKQPQVLQRSRRNNSFDERVTIEVTASINWNYLPTSFFGFKYRNRISAYYFNCRGGNITWRE